jgi:formylglycine-generating enzyme required for sulfatase activity
VTDTVTGLIWQKADGGEMTWEAALQYAEGLSLAGRTDWRLPNIKELQSINDETRSGPSLNTTIFPGAQAARTWSNTSEINGKDRAWYVDFQLGIVSYQSKMSKLYVRCVRGGADETVVSTDSVPQFVRIPAGQFAMGDHHSFVDPAHPSDEVPIHTVSLDSFYMGTTLVTCGEYCTYLNAALAQGLIEVRSGYVYGVGGTEIYSDTLGVDPASRIEWTDTAFTVRDQRDLHPITGIRWFGALAYCNWASIRDGYEPCYNLTTGACDFTCDGYRLPTEAEWEYAARGGQYNPYRMFPWGDDTNADGSLANWPGSGDPYETGPYPWTTPVGFYNGQLHNKADFGWPGTRETHQTRSNANGYGLYDMSGNVWQWVNDWYGRNYYQYCVTNNIVVNPPGPLVGGSQRWNLLQRPPLWHGQQDAGRRTRLLSVSGSDERDPCYQRPGSA